MYSVMLAAMLTTTTSATPDWGCHGCCGCHGYAYNAFSCSCYGCYGCHGCCGGCYGCHGCCGGCYGCCGGCWGSYSACWGCCGGCCGGVVYVGCSCSGCCGGGTTAASAASGGGMKSLEEENRALKEQLKKLQGGKPGSKEEVSTPAPAHVVVKLPDDARLMIDDTACPLTSTRREFNTPDLNPGQAYYYTLKAEVMRAGQPVTASKRVIVRAGEESVVDFGEMRTLETVSR